MIYNDIVSIIGILPEGYEWIYGVVSGFVICTYVYVFLRILTALVTSSTRGRY